jgi:hypothetical protein
MENFTLIDQNKMDLSRTLIELKVHSEIIETVNWGSPFKK